MTLCFFGVSLLSSFLYVLILTTPPQQHRQMLGKLLEVSGECQCRLEIVGDNYNIVVSTHSHYRDRLSVGADWKLWG